MDSRVYLTKMDRGVPEMIFSNKSVEQASRIHSIIIILIRAIALTPKVTAFSVSVSF